MSEGQKKLMQGLMATILESRSAIEAGALARQMPDDELLLAHEEAYREAAVNRTALPRTMLDAMSAEMVRRGPGYLGRALQLLLPRMPTDKIDERVVQLRKALKRKVPSDQARIMRLYLDMCAAEMAKRAALA